MSSRRFLLRWSLRLLKREWREQIGVLSLIAAVVALSIGGVVAAFNLTEPPGFRYGTGNVRATITGDATEAVESLQAQANPFGVIESVLIAEPGSATLVDVRVQDPQNRVTAPLLALAEGRWPSVPSEIAVTNAAPTESRTIGDSVSLGGNTLRIVGVVENPTDLSDEFVLGTDLVMFDVEEHLRSTAMLVEADPADVTFPSGTWSINTEDKGTDPAARTVVAIAVSIASAVAMLMVMLMTGAAFAVLARRRARQYGLLAAAGGTPRQIRQAVALTGLTTGVLAALLGATAGLLVAFVVVPRMEQTVGHRIDFAAPWWTVVPTLGLAVLSTTAAAWWPARALSRQAVVEVLASLRPRPSSTARSTRVGAGGAAVGAVLLVVGVQRLSASLVIAGIGLALPGLLLLAPGLIRLVGGAAQRLSLTGRIAGRSIARHQGRSAALVAALTLALAIPVGVAAVTASLDRHNATKAANLEDNMAIVWAPGLADEAYVIPAESSPDAIDLVADKVEALGTGVRTAAIQVVVDPGSKQEPVTLPQLGTVLGVGTNLGLRPADKTCGAICDVNTLGDRDESGNEILVSFHSAWVANPALFDALRIETVPEAEVANTQAVSRFADAMIRTHRGQSEEFVPAVAYNETIPANTSLAPTLIWPETVAANGWNTATIGVLIVADEPLTVDQAAAISGAAGDDLLVEVADPPDTGAGVRIVAIGVGAVIAFGILLSALALVRAELSDDLRLLQAVGASPRVHRSVSAATAAILTGAGALVAIPTGYLALVVLLADRSTDFEFVIPWSSLFVIGLVLPAIAGAIGWITSTTQTTGLARRLS